MTQLTTTTPDLQERWSTLSQRAQKFLRTHLAVGGRELDWRHGTPARVAPEVKALCFEQTRKHCGKYKGHAPRTALWALRPEWLAFLSQPIAAPVPAPLPVVPHPLPVETWTCVTPAGTHTYISLDGGRWFCKGDSPLNAPKAQTSRLFAGCADIDVENCHPNLLLQFLQQKGVDTQEFDAIASFAKFPGEWRDHAAESYGIPVKGEARCAKRLLLALQYGASEAGETVMDITGGQALTQPLHILGEQMQKAMALVRKLTPEFKDIAVRAKLRQAEAAGTYLPLSGKQAWRGWAAVTRAHGPLVLQAQERKVLDACRAFHEAQGERILVPMHDGYRVSAAGVQLESLSAYVAQATGYVLHFTSK